MKKIIILLAVLACGVGESYGWGNVYINSEDNNWGNGSASYSNQLSASSGNHYYIILESSKLTWQDGYFYFRFWVKNDDNKDGRSVGAGDDSKPIITKDGYSSIGENENTFRLQYDASVSKILINFDYYDSSWHLHAFKNVTYNVAFKKPVGWGTPKAHIWTYNYDCAAWPGTTLVNDDAGVSSIYSASGIEGFENARVIFTDKEGNSGTQLPEISLTNNSVYEVSDGNAVLVGNQTISLPTNDVGTYSSDYPLTFPGGDVNIRAYKAEMEGGKVKLSRVTGVVPAKTGLVIARKDAENNSMDAVPAAVATADVTGNLLKPGTGSAVASEGTTYRYALAKKKSTSEICFAELAAGSNNTVAIGKAYLEVTSGAAPSFEIFFDDAAGGTTAIDAVKSAEPAVTDGAYYNLAGQRVTNPTKGLYIVNGRKVVVK